MAIPTLSIVKGSNESETNFQDNINSQRNDDLTADKLYLLELSNKLHSTLDLNHLITLFKLDITPILNLDDVIYHSPGAIKPVNAKGRHMLSYQLKLHQASLGEIAMIRRTRFSSVELQFIEKALVALLAPLDHALSYQKALNLASHDPLTGVYNRYAMDKMVSRETELSQRNDMPLSMLAMDIDFFKKVNDEHGHAFGDCVLKHFVECVQQCSRTSDAIFRYGGEEFNLLLNNTDVSGAQELAERVRHYIEQTPCICDGQSINITVSIGISTFNHDDSIKKFFKQSDDALYQAKASGRNQVIVA